ncbi:NAD(P)H-dependent oxidoreductase [Limosilactobacillus sp.]|jgi:putative NADPH-quinone reductase|uniref:NAD(P)H-dependent oxidoreductase n=1 Tax=Limosilactobacillus sp. TaxID=2773925 RepID=UPI0025B7AC70|nr:NAD(P)H-dependent oxidoreductase [Limosilactobacillus sp.]MCH3922054.1 NAD(P)H-dependent oxidoreductase [Limosilactobacillus sp.]MCH3928825.1 NAD(P)H-dependent oxidoreductase [Limosilactobacillus sp.]
MKTVVLLFHPNYGQSRANKTLANALDSDITVRNMYALYPDGKIDVEAEKKVLEDADRVVLQFPIMWYSSPALLKQWEDDVFEYGWAYGEGGTALHGKELLLAVTPGAHNYGRNGFVKYTVTELLRPFQATSRLIGMTYLKPFITIGASSISDEDLNSQAKKYNQYLHEDQLPVLSDFE